MRRMLTLLALMLLSGCGVSRDEVHSIAEDHADAQMRQLQSRIEELEQRVADLETQVGF